MAPPLSPRLSALADEVVAGAAMADIGTDHAQLPSWLVAAGRVPRAIGIDVHEAPLRAARATAVAGVELRHGDGLTVLRDHEACTVVIAGMGGDRIRRIVDAGVPAGVRRLVLQPNTDWPGTRAWLRDRPWTLHAERMVEDRGKFYALLVVELVAAAVAPVWDEADLELGPRLRRAGDPVWQAWVRTTCERLHTALRSAGAAAPDDPRRRALARRLEIFEAARRTPGAG